MSIVAKKKRKKVFFFKQFKSDFNGFYNTGIYCAVTEREKEKMFKIKNQFQAMHSMRSRMRGKVTRYFGNVTKKNTHRQTNIQTEIYSDKNSTIPIQIVSVFFFRRVKQFAMIFKNSNWILNLSNQMRARISLSFFCFPLVDWVNKFIGDRSGFFCWYALGVLVSWISHS